MISVGEATGKDGEDEDGTNGGLCPCNGYNVCLWFGRFIHPESYTAVQYHLIQNFKSLILH